jgi:outer membrane protein OmpA-like peptidoglycan-associated protein
MRRAALSRVSALIVVGVFALPSSGEAQIFKKLKETVTQAAEDELLSQTDQLVRSGVSCPFNDFACIDGAKESGDDYYLTDANGEMVVDGGGAPVTDPYLAAEQLGEPSPSSPGGDLPPPPGAGAVPPADFSTAYSNYDFVPGDRVLVDDEYRGDNVGDFPRHFALVEGSFEVIEWQGERYVRALSGGSFAIPLPGTLPEQFTVETAINLQHGNAYFRLTPGRAYFGKPRSYKGSAVAVEFGRGGVRAAGSGPDALAQFQASIVQDAIVPVRILADGDHMKVYLGEERIANVPNAVFPRSDTLFVAVGSATPDHPILVGGFRIAAGGRDLYDRLADEGRVATQGIHFDVNSATIRSESSTTLDEIGSMLQQHPDLRISIEGHTDADGDDASNLDLSERRAAAVKDRLVAEYGIDPSRLESVGLGETVPVADNASAEGKQQNRRVELVRL